MNDRQFTCATLVAGAALLLPTSLWAAASASLDRSAVPEGDTVNLTITVDGTDGSAQPDLSALGEDFDVLGTSHGTQVRIINGHRTDRVTWTVQLQPRESGTVAVPAIAIGGDTTQPLTLQVSEQPAGATAVVGDATFITVEAEPADKTPYVREQLRYKVRLFSKEQILDGNLTAPGPDDAVVEQLGQDRRYSTRIGSDIYQVVERDYAIFPEKSGELRIPPIAFRGRVASDDARRRTANPFGRMDSMMGDMLRDPFFGRFLQGRSLASRFMGGGKPVSIQGEPVVVDVKARPDGARGSHWLPAQAVTLTDSWAVGLPTFVVGEPVTRTITLEAKGAVSSQLPEIRIPAADGVRVYPEQQHQRNVTDGEWVYGRLTQSFSVMPTRDGVLSLPEVRVDWWDTASDRDRSATIPGFEVQVLPGAGVSQDAAVAESSTPVVATRADEVTPAPGPDAVPVWRKNATAWLLAALIAALATAVFGRRRARRLSIPKASQASGTRRAASRQRADLRRACQENDAPAASRALLGWSAETWPDDAPRSLLDLAGRLATGAGEVHELNRALYGTDGESWTGGALWQALRGGLVPRRESTMATEPLPPLYPQHP